jgi:hypothetical protein
MNASRRQFDDLRTAHARHEKRAVGLAPLLLAAGLVVALPARRARQRLGHARLVGDEAFEGAHEASENVTRTAKIEDFRFPSRDMDGAAPHGDAEQRATAWHLRARSPVPAPIRSAPESRGSRATLLWRERPDR